MPFADEERLENIRYLVDHENEDVRRETYVSCHLSTRLRLQNIVATLKGLLQRLEPAAMSSVPLV